MDLETFQKHVLEILDETVCLLSSICSELNPNYRETGTTCFRDDLDNLFHLLNYLKKGVFGE